MARQTIATTNLVGRKEPVLTDLLATSSHVDGMAFQLGSNYLLIAINTDNGVSQTRSFWIEETPSANHGRSAQQGVGLSSGDVYVGGPFEADGFMQSDGYGHVSVNTPDAGPELKFFSVRIK